MKRKTFLKSLTITSIMGAAMKLEALNNLSGSLSSTAKMPLLFLGHGSPMNAIEENEFVTGFREVGKTLPKPKAILCISAHWETRGTYVTAMDKPMTIHDFGGFPQRLFEVQYPAPGSPELALEMQKMVVKTTVGLDQKWGLDHGCWSVVKHLYPEADVLVIQMSLDYYQTPQFHYDLAKELAPLRNKGILIVGSGNLVHNLHKVAWEKLNEIGYGFDWALEANDKMKKYMLDGDHQRLINFKSEGKAFDLAIPTPEHYLPLLYILGLKENHEELTIFNDKAVAGSLTMTSVKIGAGS
ncbi:MAG TPA: 4,5-DOPA dioxygenase extradiol [Prolixibacteraceae bacterium]